MKIFSSNYLKLGELAGLIRILLSTSAWNEVRKKRLMPRNMVFYEC